MSYSIRTWLDGGEPRLGIVDTETGEITLQWRLVKVDTPGRAPLPPRKTRTASKIQQLTHQLFLLCCAGDMALTGRSGQRRWDDCLQCDRCTDTSDIGSQHRSAAPGIQMTVPGTIIPFPTNRHTRREHD